MRKRVPFSATVTVTNIVKPGSLFHFLPRRNLAQALVHGLVNDELASTRGLDFICLAQLTPEDLQRQHPLEFDGFNIADYIVER